MKTSPKPTNPFMPGAADANPLPEWIAQLFDSGDLLKMGHCQRPDDLNLGMGWLYYGFARLMRPRTVVVIGSWRGFSPLVFGRALSDNAEGGRVIFIDPSMVDDFWKDEEKTRAYFAGFGVTNIEHFGMTTQEFVKTAAYRSLSNVGLVMVDGMHTEEQARFDCEAFAPLVPKDGALLLHDSCTVVESRVYGKDKPYLRTVKYFVDALKKDASWQVFDLPFGEGLTLVRKA